MKPRYNLLSVRGVLQSFIFFSHQILTELFCPTNYCSANLSQLKFAHTCWHKGTLLQVARVKWTKCDEEVGGSAGGDGEQPGEGLLGAAQGPRGHGPLVVRICKRPLPGSMVGPTFACIISKQFHNFRSNTKIFPSDL